MRHSRRFRFAYAWACAHVIVPDELHGVVASGRTRRNHQLTTHALCCVPIGWCYILHSDSPSVSSSVGCAWLLSGQQACLSTSEEHVVVRVSIPLYHSLFSLIRQPLQPCGEVRRRETQVELPKRLQRKQKTKQKLQGRGGERSSVQSTAVVLTPTNERCHSTAVKALEKDASPSAL